jgi:hypothetical protein
MARIRDDSVGWIRAPDTCRLWASFDSLLLDSMGSHAYAYLRHVGVTAYPEDKILDLLTMLVGVTNVLLKNNLPIHLL